MAGKKNLIRILQMTNNKTEKKIEVDDKMVGSYFGVTSYEEFEVYAGPYGRDYAPILGPGFDWIESHPEEWKRQIWEDARERIHQELLGLCPPWYTKDGKVVPFVKNPVTLRDWLSPGKQKVYKLPIDQSRNDILRCYLPTANYKEGQGFCYPPSM
jgi:hypothetical protein